MSYSPQKRRPEALKGTLKVDAASPGEGGALYSAFSEARKTGGRITIGRAVESYLAYVQGRGFAEGTLRGTKNLLSAFYRAGGFAPSTPLVEITSEGAERVLRAFHSRYNPRTAYSYATRLLLLFRVFASGGLILENPFAKIDPPPKPKPLPAPTLSHDEVRRLMAAPDLHHPAGIRQRAMLEVFYSTAVRLGESRNLRLGDIDFAQETLLVRGGKGRKDRIVPLGKEAGGWLHRYLVEVRPRYADKEVEDLWIGISGRPVNDSWMQKTVRWLGRRAGIEKPVTPHTLRRTCVTHLLAAGASAWVVKDILGHTDAKTLGRYLNVAPEELKHVHEEAHPRG